MDANHTTPDLSIDSNKRETLSPSLPYAYGSFDRPFRRNGMRPQQARGLENHTAEQALPAKMEPSHPLQRKPTKKFSLFGLFGRENSEKQQQNAIYNQTTPPPTPPISANFSLPQPDAPPLRPSSSARDASHRGPAVPPKDSHPTQSTLNPAPRVTAVSAHRSVSSWDPPPLFQAYAQSTKHGLLEFPNASFSSPNPTRGRKTSASQSIIVDNRSRDSAEDTRSIETKRATKTGLSRHNNSLSEDVPKKIFILINSGYLLQYSDTGPSERLPERCLQLGMESAAFASDVIPGRHHVIQVFQAVDANGESVASSGSYFSRLGKRSAASKQMTSSILLLMPDGREMDSWIFAFREKIEDLGGKKARPDTADTTAVRPSTGESLGAVQGSRDLSTADYPFHIRNEPLNSVNPILQSQVEPVSPQLSSPSSAATYDDEKGETDTIDEIDDLAAELDERLSPAKARGESDFFSFASTVATTVDLNPRSTLRNSQRRSDASAATLATTVDTPAATSPHGSPMFEDMVNGAFQTPSENKSPPTGSHSESRRQSSAQRRSPRGQNLPKFDVLAQAQEETSEDEVDSKRGSGLKPYLLPPMRAPMAAASSPDLRALAEARSRHDSKMPLPPLPVREDKDQLSSILAGMPPLNSWLSNSSLDIGPFPTPAVDGFGASPACQNGHHKSPYTHQSQRQKRRSRAFNMPMKINPSLPFIDPPDRMVNRDSRLFDEDEFQSPVPVVHTLTAKGGEESSHPSSGRRRSLTSPKSEIQNRLVARNTATRPFMLSTATPPPLPSPLLSLSPMLVGLNEANAQPSPAISQGKVPGMPLKRPPSIRVSSNHAPFLQSIRTSGSGLPGQACDSPANTPSLRTLRSSQSYFHLPMASPSLSPTGSFGMPSPSLQTSDTPRDGGLRLTPSVKRDQSPLPPTPGGATPHVQKRKSRSPRNALPELDLGIPVAGLGPPAPPPSAPLPLPPQMNGSRNVSPLPSPMASPRLPNPPSGLGIRI